jgi:lipopolysaccharide transport system permease protein
LRSISIAALLAGRELLTDYRQSRLSPLWPTIQPLAYALLFIVLRPLLGVPPDEGIPWRFALFAFVGMLTWQVWMEVMRAQMDGVRRHRSLMTRGELDAGTQFLATTLTALAHFLPGLMLAGAVAVFVLGAGLDDLLWFVFFGLSVVLNGAVIGAALQPFATLSGDIGRTIQSVSLALMISGAVFLPLPEEPPKLLFALVAANPLGALLNAAREPLIGGQWLSPVASFGWFGATVLLALLVPRINRKVLPILIERIGS